MLATLVVDSLADNTLDDGLITLREAILAANNDVVADPTEGSQTGSGADVIQFDPVLTAGGPATIFLQQGELQITESLTIDGPSSALLTIDASSASRVINVDDGQIAAMQVVEISDVTLTGGNVFAEGGAIYNREDLTINRSTLTGNLGGIGGGVFSSGGALTINRSTLSDNLAELGGGIANFSNTLTIHGSTISGNASANGGGVYHYGGSLTISDSTISGNSADDDGGGVYILAAPANPTTVTNSTISGNWARDHGGGIAVANSAELVLRHTTITANTSDFDSFGGGEGGGISFVSQSRLVLDHTLIAANASNSGAATDIFATGPIVATFSLIGDNAGTALAPAPTPDAAGNLIGSSAGSGIISPVLGSLTNNGGPTSTHALLIGSPAIDAGDPTFPADPGDSDQRAAPFVRVFDGDGTGGARIDIGAYERQSLSGVSLIVDTTADENDGDYSAGDLSLREAIGLANASIGPDRIEFDASLDGQTVHLTLGELEVTEALSIEPSTPGDTLIVDAQQRSRIFNITSTSGDFALSNLVLSGGSADGDGAEGGAVRSMTSGSLTLSECTVSDSSAFGPGGGVFAAGAVTLTQSTISGNRSAVGMGFADTRGGGLFAGGDLSVNQSTITANIAEGTSGQGGGIYAVGDLSVANTIVAGNTANFGPDLLPGTATLNVDYSLIGNTSDTGINAGSGTGNVLNQNPLLGPLANNGGPARTHALLPGSPAIDAGDPAKTFNPNEFDLRGAPFVRVFNGDGSGGAIVDIGAYERQTLVDLSLVVDTLVDEDDGDYSAGDLSLREAIGLANGSIGSNEIEFAPTLTNGGPATINLTHGELFVSEATTIIGPGANLLSVSASANDPTPNLNDGAGSRVLNFDDGSAASSNAAIIGLTLSGGDAGGNGGAVRSLEDLTITDSNVSGNSADGLGGGIYAGGNVTFLRTTVSGNSSHSAAGDSLGGGVFANGAATLTDSTVTGNIVHAGDGNSSGGGIHAGGNVTLSTSTVSANSASSESGDSRGGGILTAGSITLTNSTVSGNSLLGMDAVGGGILAGGVATLFDSTVGYNTANTHQRNGDARGGGLAIMGSATLASSNVSGNRALGYTVNGGGLAVDGTLTISRSSVRYNTAQGNTAIGGGIQADGTVSISSSSIGGNFANSIVDVGSARGGGIDADDSVALINSSITGNTVRSSGGNARGGGVFADGNVTVMGSAVSGNNVYTSGGYAGGGGIRATEAISLFSSTVNDNSAVGLTSARGGGVVAGADATVEASTVRDNVANANGGNSRGGGLYAAGDVTISGTTFSGNSLQANTGDARGGAVFAGSDLTLTSGTLSGNDAAGSSGRGGGVYAGGNASIAHSTIAQNNAPDLGGGVYVVDSLTTTHAIVATNSSADSPDLHSGDDSLSIHFSLIGNAIGTSLDEAQTPDSNGNLIGTSDLEGTTIDPLLAPLANNGGSNSTHSLLPGSPAINAGDPSFVPPPLADQRGFVRVANGRIDMGALETGAPPLPSFDFVVDIAVDEFDWDFGNGDLSLREAIVLSNIDPEVRTITFQPSLSGATIQMTLALGEMNISDSVTIDGSDLPGGIIIDAGRGNDAIAGNGDGIRVFLIDDHQANTTIDVELVELTLTGGDINGDGGAIRSRENLTLSGSTISGNSAYMGGGLFSSSGRLTISGSTINGNSAYGGGGIVTSAGTGTISGSTISGNSATGYAGGIDNVSGTLTISRSTISGNSANLGGGVRNYYGTMMINNSTFSGNSADASGGGLYNFSGTLTINSSTITSNSAGTVGGGVYSEAPVGTHTLIGSSIVSGNAGGDVGRSVTIPNNTFQSMGFNLIGIGNAVGAFTNNDQTGVANPQLGPLQDNGGATFTHAVQLGSPAIDAGDPSIAFNPADFDQRGAPFLRVRDGGPPSGARIDVGAFEVQIPSPPDLLGDYNRDGRVNTADFTLYRDTFGDLVAPFNGADGNGDGTISESDYDVWKSQFGNELATASSASTALAESLTSSLEATTGYPWVTGNALARGPVESLLVVRSVGPWQGPLRLSQAAHDSVFSDPLQQLLRRRVRSRANESVAALMGSEVTEQFFGPVDEYFAEVGSEAVEPDLFGG